MIISLDYFRGMKPRVSEHLLEPNMASLARNTNLLNGSLRPWKNNLLTIELEQTSLIKTIFKYLDAYWFEFSADVDLHGGPIANDTTNRIYYTGIGIPKKTNETEATTGSAPYPINFYPIGAPEPVFAPVAALGGGGSGDARSLGYVYTIVTSWGEEGPPSLPSNIVSALPGQTVNISGVQVEWEASQAYQVGMWAVPTTLVDHVYMCVVAGISGGSEPTWETTIDGDTVDNTVTWRAYDKEILYGTGGAKRLYRILTGDTFGDYFFVGSIAMGTEVYVDAKLDTDVAGGTILPSNGWYGPPINMTGLTSVGRFFVGFSGKDLIFSEPNHPHAWPTTYQFPLDFPIVALGSIGNSIIVGTEQNPYIIHGTHPEVMTPVKLPDSHPCVAKRGMVAFPSGIAYPTNSGLYFISGGMGQVITRESYSKEDWALLHPETWHAARHDGRYVAFYDDGAGDDGGLIIDLNGEISMLDFFATALYIDPKTDTLYYNTETPIV